MPYSSSSDLVRQVMLDHFNEGFDQRTRRGKSKARHEGILRAVGPMEEVSIDGHDKLSALGFPIYGMRDKYSRCWLVLEAVPSNRTNSITAYLYLRMIRELQGELHRCMGLHTDSASSLLTAVPLQLTSDCGNEVLDIYSYQSSLRYVLFSLGMSTYHNADIIKFAVHMSPSAWIVSSNSLAGKSSRMPTVSSHLPPISLLREAGADWSSSSTPSSRQ